MDAVNVQLVTHVIRKKKPQLLVLLVTTAMQEIQHVLYVLLVVIVLHLLPK